MHEEINIYFAGSIRGGREDVLLYQRFIRFLRQFGHVLTEHIGEQTLTLAGDEGMTDLSIHDRDLEWLLSADIVVAEVTAASLGVGYELGRAVALGKKVICLYRPQPLKRISAMIAGCPGITTLFYQEADEAESALSEIIFSFIRDKEQ